jgi:hypothetical protein
MSVIQLHWDCSTQDRKVRQGCTLDELLDLELLVSVVIEEWKKVLIMLLGTNEDFVVHKLAEGSLNFV